MFGYILLYIFMSNIFSIDELKNYGIIMIFCNILVGVVTIIISKISYYRKFVNRILDKLNKSSKFQIIILSTAWAFTLSFICYSILKFTINVV